MRAYGGVARLHAVIFAAALLEACAGPGGPAPARLSYRRADLADRLVPGVEVVVEVAPDREAPELEVLRRSSTLVVSPAESGALSAALDRAARALLAARGFVATATDGGSLERTSGVADILARSRAGLVLVVRARWRDALVVEGAQEAPQLLDPAAASRGAPLLREVASGERGLWFTGDAVLLERRSGLRLWSQRTAPLPRDGRVEPGSPLLALGAAMRSGAAGDVEEAASAFVGAVLAGLPGVAPPDAGRAASPLDEVDVVADERRIDLRERGRWALELASSWGLETLTLTPVSREGVTLPSLGREALAPLGVLRAGPRLTAYLAGGTALSVSAAVARAPGTTRRFHHVDATDAAAGETAGLVLDAKGGAGVEVLAGPVVVLAERWLFLPRAGVFAEGWRLSGPGERAADLRLRAGAVGRIEALFRLGARWFVRGDFGVRAGRDTGSAWLFGAEAGASVGAFLEPW